MSDILMRVTRAVSHADQDCAGDYRKLARAAIEAMREPTEEMVAAVGSHYGPALEADWHTMIDAALDNKPQPLDIPPQKATNQASS